MDQTRPVAVGPLLAGFGAIVLLGSLFVDWFEPALSGWTAFEVLDLILALLALAAIAVAAQGLGLGLSKTRVPEGILLGVAAVALVIVVSQLINHPPRALARDTAVGIWLALVAALVMVAGAALGSSYVSVVHKDDAPGGSPSAGSPRPDPRRRVATRLLTSLRLSRCPPPTRTARAEREALRRLGGAFGRGAGGSRGGRS